jgi:hypothetical protein
MQEPTREALKTILCWLHPNKKKKTRRRNQEISPIKLLGTRAHRLEAVLLKRKEKLRRLSQVREEMRLRVLSSSMGKIIICIEIQLDDKLRSRLRRLQPKRQAQKTRVVSRLLKSRKLKEN